MPVIRAPDTTATMDHHRSGSTGSAAAAGSKKQKQKEKQKQLTELLRSVQQTIAIANKEPDILQHFAAFKSFNKAGLAASISFSRAAQLAPEQRAAIWELFESNMRGIYQADNQRWRPKEKQKELFHDDARYFIATDDQGKLLAYTHFRFEVEENLLAPEEVAAARLAHYDPVAYCYELQLAPEAQRKGLGRRLMQMLELTALKYQMHLVLLTVQRSNAAALAFYSAAGYKQHPSCPERNGFDDFDGVDPGHRIMWKDLRRN